MLTIDSSGELKKHLKKKKEPGWSLGFVPTMGALHDGHFGLLKHAREDNDLVVASIFVNPLQFDRKEDFDNYPKNLAEDLKRLEENGCDLAFVPSPEEMYRQKPIVSVDFGDMANSLEGKYRPGHFSGVGIVLVKLFHMVVPDRAYFGLKDMQQYLLVKRMVEDLSFDLEVIGVPTVREQSGLAKSSRNLRLTTDGKILAANIYGGLCKAADLLKKKITIDEIKNELGRFYEGIDGLDMEYFEIVNASTLEPISGEYAVEDLAIAAAGYVEGVRLIDNLYLRFDS